MQDQLPGGWFHSSDQPDFPEQTFTDPADLQGSSQSLHWSLGAAPEQLPPVPPPTPPQGSLPIGQTFGGTPSQQGQLPGGIPPVSQWGRTRARYNPKYAALAVLFFFIIVVINLSSGFPVIAILLGLIVALRILLFQRHRR